MNDNKSELNSSSGRTEDTSQCGPGCNCGTTGSRPKWKMIICMVVLIAAVVVLTRGFARNAGNKATMNKGSFATTAPAIAAAAGKADTTKTNQTKSPLWAKPLKGMASLNEVATDKNAVFVYLAEKGQKPDKSIMRNIEQAADKSKGMAIAFYLLDAGSQDYAQITSQTPAPCVLAMVKGGGSSMISGDISETKLIQAIVAASRPSSCGPSGCGPSSSGCN